MTQYTDVNESTFMQKWQESQARPSGGGFAGYWRPKAAPLGKMPLRNVVRPLPPHPNMQGDPIVGTKIHFGLGPAQDTACPCLEPYSEACPACDWVDHLFKQAKSEPDANRAAQFRSMAFRMRAKLRFFMNVVDLAKPEDGVQVWAFGNDTEKMVRNCFLDDQMPPRFRNITHPETGRGIVIEAVTKEAKFKGAQSNTYEDIESMRPQEQPAPLQDPAWLDAIKDLTEEVYKPTVEQVQGALQGKKVTRTAGALPAAPPVSALPAAPPPRPAPSPVPATSIVLPPPTVAVPPTPPLVPTPPSPPAGRARRQPVGSTKQPVIEATAAADPYAQARAEVLRLGAAASFSTPKDIDAKALAALPKPSCYGRETDPTDAGCQDCSVLVWCMGVKLGLVAA